VSLADFVVYAAFCAGIIPAGDGISELMRAYAREVGSDCQEEDVMIADLNGGVFLCLYVVVVDAAPGGGGGGESAATTTRTRTMQQQPQPQSPITSTTTTPMLSPQSATRRLHPTTAAPNAIYSYTDPPPRRQHGESPFAKSRKRFQSSASLSHSQAKPPNPEPNPHPKPNPKPYPNSKPNPKPKPKPEP
jgi:hypothetical protein